MHLIIALAALLAAPALAHPQLGHYLHGSHIPGAVRGPCPGLNSLANHGYLPRDGKGITQETVVNAMSEVYNLDPSAGNTLAIPTLAVIGYNNGEERVFDLDKLSVPGFIEHDASISRKDRALVEDQNHPDKQRVKNLFRDSNGVVDLDYLAKVRCEVVADSIATNPDLVFGPEQQNVALSEAAFLVMSLGKDTNSTTTTKLVESMLIEERLIHPFSSWRRSIPCTLDNCLRPGAAQIAIRTVGLCGSTGSKIVSQDN